MLRNLFVATVVDAIEFATDRAGEATLNAPDGGENADASFFNFEGRQKTPCFSGH